MERTSHDTAIGVTADDDLRHLQHAHAHMFKKVLMLRIDVLLESGDTPQEFFDRHAFKIRYGVFWRSSRAAQDRSRIALAVGRAADAAFRIAGAKSPSHQQ